MIATALSVPGARLYFAGAVPSVMALWAQRVTLGWLAWEVSGQASYVGFVAALSMAPTLISGPVFGVLVDRSDILRATRWTTGAMIALLVVVALVAMGPGLDRLSLALSALAVGVVSSAHHPVRMSLAPRLVPRDLVPSIVALSALNFNVGRLIAPVGAGLAIAQFGAVATLWAAAVMYAPMLLIVGRLRPRALTAKAQQDSIFVALREGFRFVMAAPVIRRAVLLTAVFATMVRGYLEILPVMAEGVHARGAEGLGVLTAVSGGGAMLAALAKTAGVGESADRVPGVVLAVLIAGMGLLPVLGVVPGWGMALVLTGAIGFSSTFVGVSLQAVVQAQVADDMRGRIMSLWVVVGFGAVAVGAAGLGLVAQVVGLPMALVIGGGAGLLALIPVIWRG